MKNWLHIYNKNLRCSNDDERFWCALALSKLSRLDDALLQILGGSTSFRMELRCQILLIEIEIFQKNYPSARQRLVQIADQCRKNSYFYSHWERLSRKVVPSVTSKSKAKILPKNNSDWQRYLSIHQHLVELHLCYIKWLIKQQSELFEIKTACELILQNLIISHQHTHELFTILKSNNSCWDFIIEVLFPYAHKINPQPLRMWQIWWRYCPQGQRQKFTNTMSELLTAQPNFHLEDWLSLQTKALPN